MKLATSDANAAAGVNCAVLALFYARHTRTARAHDTGSSATSGLLSSSPNVSNLCTAKVWQCEGEKLLMTRHQFSAKFRNHLKKNGGKTGLLNTTLVDEEMDWKKAIMYATFPPVLAAISYFCGWF